MKKKYLILRIAILVVAVMLTFVLQTTVLQQIPYVTIQPNLLLIIVCSVGLIRDKSKGMWVGFFSGLLVDIFFGGEVLGIYALIYTFIGYFSGLLSSILLKDTVPVAMIFCFGSEVLYHGYVYVFTYLLRKRFEFPIYLRTVVLPELVTTMICMLVIYGLGLLLDSFITDKERKGDNRLV